MEDIDASIDSKIVSDTPNNKNVPAHNAPVSTIPFSLFYSVVRTYKLVRK